MRKKYKRINVEEEYQDVLMNIEMALLGVYRQNRSLRDFDFETVVNEAIRYFNAKERNKSFTPKVLSEERQEIYDRLNGICNLLLNNFDEAVDKDGKPMDLDVDFNLTVDILILCLKRIRKSIQTWGKRNGPKGYVTFIDDFMDGKFTD